MATVETVDIPPLPPERFRDILPDRYPEFEVAMDKGRAVFEGRTVWNLNSTARGGGVAEMLRSLLAYAKGIGIDARWAVIKGDPDFFRVTKRIHNRLHGAAGDGGELGDAELAAYRATMERNVEELTSMVRPDDVVILHDPQTAGLTEALSARCETVIWRCHVGLDHPNELAKEAWTFLRGFLGDADAYVFSRKAFVWEDLPDEKIEIIPPSIDAFSPKNQDLSDEDVRAILVSAGIVTGDAAGRASFKRFDGSDAMVERSADLSGSPKLDPDVPVLTQVSRWDRLKDPLGVIEGFARHVDHPELHLLLAGPATEGVADDPEGSEVLQEVIAARDDLPPEDRDRIHIVSLPMEDGEENAVMVNALQRHSTVVTQKSLAEGFGLTVAEAMWKGRPVVATRIGGIQDQIVHGETGLLIDDPRDLGAFGAAVNELAADPEKAEAMGRAAYERVRDEFLGPRHLTQYLDLIVRITA